MMLKSLRVLVVDDDAYIRDVLFEVLEYVGARVALASSAGEGLDAVESFRPQVIVCDITMPVEDGYAFMRKLRAREAGRLRIPAMALTVRTTVNDRRRALAAGFQAYVAKPIEIYPLRAAVLQLSTLVA